MRGIHVLWKLVHGGGRRIFSRNDDAPRHERAEHPHLTEHPERPNHAERTDSADCPEHAAAGDSAAVNFTASDLVDLEHAGLRAECADLRPFRTYGNHSGGRR
jgi:hypothetical protein